MKKERVKIIITEVFAKTFDPIFTLRLSQFMSQYREDVLKRYDWYREFGFHVRVDGTEKPTFDLLPIEELVINTICDKLEQEEKQNGNSH